VQERLRKLQDERDKREADRRAIAEADRERHQRIERERLESERQIKERKAAEAAIQLVANEQSEWDRVNLSNSIFDVRKFLEKYPDGRNAAAARAKLESLDAPPVWAIIAGFVFLLFGAYAAYSYGIIGWLWTNGAGLLGWMVTQATGKVLVLVVFGFGFFAAVGAATEDKAGPVPGALAAWLGYFLICVFFWDQPCSAEHNWLNSVLLFPESAACYLHALSDNPNLG